MWIFIILLVILLIWFLSTHTFKVPKLDCLTLISGGVKTGKSMLSVYLVKRLYNKVHTKYKIECFFINILNFLRKRSGKIIPLPEEPLVYSNVKLAGIPFTEFTEDHLLRKVRFNYKSIVYVQEYSLVADSMCYRNADDNERLLMFHKLIGHELKGGSLILDTQTVADTHYTCKRSLSSYLYIHHGINIPFFRLLFVEELAYSDDNSSVNAYTSDVEDFLSIIVVPKFIWKMYDSYCYSVLTDNLPVKNDIKFIKIDRKGAYKKLMKQDKIVSIKKFITLNGGKENVPEIE